MDPHIDLHMDLHMDPHIDLHMDLHMDPHMDFYKDFNLDQYRAPYGDLTRENLIPIPMGTLLSIPLVKNDSVSFLA